jgi:hypothetical protein
MERQDAINEDIERRLKGLRLDDKWYDEFKADKGLNVPEPAPQGEAQQVQELPLEGTRLMIRHPADDKESGAVPKMTPSPAPVVVEKQEETQIPSEQHVEKSLLETPTPEPPATTTAPSEQVIPAAPPEEIPSDTSPGQIPTAPPSQQIPTLVRFRRPVLNDEDTSESYETLTMSEVQHINAQVEADLKMQLSYEELRLALGDFDEVDEFEEVDDFEEEWEDTNVGVEDWNVDGNVYCGEADCDEEFLDARD